MAPDRNPKRTLKKKLSTHRGEIEKKIRASSDDQHENEAVYAKVRKLGSEYKSRRFE